MPAIQMWASAGCRGHKSSIPGLWRQIQESSKFQTSLHYTERPYLKPGQQQQQQKIHNQIRASLLESVQVKTTQHTNALPGRGWLEIGPGQKQKPDQTLKQLQGQDESISRYSFLLGTGTQRQGNRIYHNLINTGSQGWYHIEISLLGSYVGDSQIRAIQISCQLRVPYSPHQIAGVFIVQQPE